MFILDTDSLSLYQRGHGLLAQRVDALPPEERNVSVITVEEQLSGWYSLLRRANDAGKLARAYRNLVRTVEALCRMRVVPFSEAAITRYEELRKLKLGVGSMDLRIAAIVLENDATLVTRNARDFHRVPGLRTEDWSREDSS